MFFFTSVDHINSSFSESGLLWETEKASVIHSCTLGHIMLAKAPWFMVK